MAHQPTVGQGCLIYEASRTHSDAPLSLGLLWTGDQTDSETCTGHHTTLTKTDIHASSGIQTHNPSKRVAEDPRLRPHDHRDRQTQRSIKKNTVGER